jgi:hypothetical protein
MDDIQRIGTAATPNSFWQMFRGLADQPKVHFLSKSDENYMIAVPIIGAVLTIGLWLVARFGFDRDVPDFMVFLTTLIFLDSVHIVFTYALLLASPEIREWSRSDKARAKSGWERGKTPAMRFLVIAVVLGIVFYFLKISPNTATFRGMATIWLFLELLGPAHHTLAQMRGISLCYNSSLKRSRKFTEVESAMALKSEKFERILFNALLMGEVLYWLPEIFNLDKIVIPEMHSVQLVGGVLSIAAVAGLLINALYFPYQEESRKFAFIFRVVLFPLKMLTIVGGIFVRAAHGTEYLMIYRKMIKSSGLPKPKKMRVFVITTLLCLIYAIP